MVLCGSDDDAADRPQGPQRLGQPRSDGPSGLPKIDLGQPRISCQRQARPAQGTDQPDAPERLLVEQPIFPAFRPTV